MASIVAVGEGLSERGAPHLSMPALWLAYRGHEVSYVGFGLGGDREITTPLARIPATLIPGTSARDHLKLARAIERHGSRMVDRYLVLGSSVAPAASFALSSIPPQRVVYCTQDLLEPGRHPIREWFERRMARRAGRVVSNEAHRARFLASHYRLARMPEVVPTALPAAWPIPGRDESLRAELLSRAPGARVLIAAGGPFAEVRCGHEALAALAALPADHALIFTSSPHGSKARAAGEAAANRAGCRARTIFLDHLDHAELLRVFAASDAGLLLYPNDGIGNFCQCPGRLTEYAACGVPMVASAFPSLRAPIERHRLGASCDPTSPQAIANAIVTTVASATAEERARLAAVARERLAYDAHGGTLERAVIGP